MTKRSNDSIMSQKNIQTPKNLILIENREQAADLTSWLPDIDGTVVIIALTPLAMYELERNNIAFKIPEDYYELDELSSMGMDNYEKVKEFSFIIDSTINENCNEIQNYSITPASFNYLMLKYLYDSTFIHCFQLYHIFESEKPESVYVYKSTGVPFNSSDNSLIFNNNESIYARIMDLYCRMISVKWMLLPDKNTEYSNNNPHRCLTYSQNEIHKLCISEPDTLSLKVRKYIGHLIHKSPSFRYIHPLRRKCQVAEIKNGVEWIIAKDALKKTGIFPIELSAQDLEIYPEVSEVDKIKAKNLDEAWIILKENKKFRSFFLYKSIDLFSIIEDKLEYLVKVISLRCLRVFSLSTSFFFENKINALIASHYTSYFACSVAHAAKTLKIPVILWEHGPYGIGYVPMLRYTDFMFADFYFSDGMGIFDFYKTDISQANCKVIPIGSALMDRLGKNLHNSHISSQIGKRRVILYVTTMYLLNVIYINSHPPDSDNNVWITQKSIVSLLGNYPDYDVIIKLHPHDISPPLEDFIQDNHYKHISCVKTEHTLEELIKIADVIIRDYTRSTSFVEILTSNKQVFIYSDHFQIEEPQLTALKKRAYYYKGRTKFLQDLKTFLEGGKLNYTVDLSNTEYLQLNGSFLHDGKSDERAALTLRQIIRNS